MRKIIIVFFVLFLFIFHSIAQEKKTISGEVLNKHTGEKIGFASISIKGKPIGTVANDLGQFKFHFPDSLKRDTLSISSLGFRSYSKPIWAILKDSSSTFYLDTISISLQPIYVLSKGETAEQIVKKAIRNISKNFPTKMFYMDAFYRELSMRDDKYVRLIEASASIQDFGFDTDLSTTKIKINEIRKSDSYLEYDLKSQIYRKLQGDFNLLVRAYYSDYVRGLQNCCFTNFLCKENINRHSFTLTGCSYADKKLIYIINYRDTSWDSNASKRTSDIGGRIFIQSDNYAIVKFEWSVYAVNNSEQGKEWFYKNKFLSHNCINYREYNGKYYPDLIQTLEPVPSATKTNSTDSIQGKQYVLTTLMINNIITRRRDFSRIKEKEKEILYKDIYEKKFPYHPDFWRNYNILLINPTIQSVKNDLQKDKTLEEQFKNNGE